MDPREFQRLALQLATSSGAAERRSAVSRGYYAAFNVASEHLRALKFTLGKGAAAHGEIRLCLVNSGTRELMDAGVTLQELHTRRIRADYQLDNRDAELGSTVDVTVATAAAVISKLDAAFSGSARGAILASITKWRRENGYP
jgi:hypothetical protein